MDNLRVTVSSVWPFLATLSIHVRTPSETVSRRSPGCVAVTVVSVQFWLRFPVPLYLQIQAKNPVDPQELRFLLTGPTGDVKRGPDNPTSWLTDKQWEGIRALSELPSYSGLDDFFLENSDGFKAVYDAVEAHEEPFPAKWNDLTGIQVQRLRRTYRAVWTFRGVIVLKCLF